MRHPYPRTGPAAGFTLVEVAIAGALLTMAIASALMATGSSYRAYRNAQTSVTLNDQARRVLSRLSFALTTADSSLLLPDPGDERGTADLVFHQVTGIAGIDPQWGPMTRVAFEYEEGEVDDGVDNDGDGLVDEGRIVLVRDVGGAAEQMTVLCSGVAELAQGEQRNALDDDGDGVVDEAGFNVQADGDVLTVRICLQGIDAEGRLVERSVATTVRLRN